MRLVDAERLKADVFKASMDEHFMPIKLLDCDTVTEIIDTAPTIEERKTGKWVDAWRSGYGLCRYWYRKCSCCDYERDDCDAEKDTKYCPACGAKMEVDDATAL